MSLRDDIGFALKALGGNRSMATPDWSDLWMRHPFIPQEDLANYRDAFRKIPVVQACISQIQHDVANLPVRVYRGRGKARKELEAKDGNLAFLMQNANPRETGYQHRVNTVGSLLISGNAYWTMEFFGQAAPRELWCLPAHNWRVSPGPNRGITEYEYRRGGTYVKVDAKNVIHFADYNPDDEPIGMSRLESVRKKYEAEFYLTSWLSELFRKGGLLAGVWSVKDGSKKFTPDDKRAIIHSLNSQVGYDKAWNAVVVQGLELIERGMTPGELDIKGHLATINASIALALGVPPWRVGIKEGSTLGSNGASEDALIYWEGPVERTVVLLDSVVNERLVPYFGGDLYVETDMSGVLAVQSAKWNQAKSLVSLAGRPILTVNEARRSAGYDPDGSPDSDALYTRPAPALGFAESSRRRGGPESNLSQASARGLRHESEAIPATRRQAIGLTAEAREALKRRERSALEKAEARMLRFVRERVDRQEATVLARLKQRAESNRRLARGPVRLFSVFDLDGLMDEGSEADREEARRILEQLLQERGAEALDNLGEVAEAIEVRMNSTRVQRFLDTQMDRAIAVPDGTTARMLRESLQEGINADEGLDGLTQRVRDVFGSRRLNAATIARTETLPGFNFAAQEVWIESGVVDKKEWLAIHDGVARPEHEDADGQVVAIDAAFSVGGELLEYPGDPAGSAEMVINCRCSQFAHLNEEAASRVLREHFWRRMSAGPSRNGDGSRNRIKAHVGAA